MGQLIGTGVKFRVRQLGAARRDRQRLRRSLHLLGEQLVNAAFPRKRGRVGSTRPGCPVARSPSAFRATRAARAGRNGALQQRAGNARSSARSSAASNRSLLYSSAPRSSARQLHHRAASGRTSRRGFGSTASDLHVQPRQSTDAMRRVLQGEHHLEQRGAARIALAAAAPRPAVSKGSVLVRVGRRAPSRARARAARGTSDRPHRSRAQHQRVDEEADERLDLRCGCGRRSACRPRCRPARCSGAAAPGTPRAAS